VASTVTTWLAAVKELALKCVFDAEVGTLAVQYDPSDAAQLFTVSQFAAVPIVRLSVQVPVPVAVMEFSPAASVTGDPLITEVPEVTVPVVPDAI
jgi:hypothetical protein